MSAGAATASSSEAGPSRPPRNDKATASPATTKTTKSTAASDTTTPAHDSTHLDVPDAHAHHTDDSSTGSVHSSGTSSSRRSSGGHSIPRPPVISHMDPAEEASMDHTLSKKRSWLHFRPRRPSSNGPQNAEQVRKDSQRHHPRKKDKGKHKDADEVEAENEDFDPQALKAALEEEACKLQFEHIDLVVGGKNVHSAAEIVKLEQPLPPGSCYVWEIMYENQRGISLFGSAWYSWRSLLPSDPSAFTLPNNPPETDIVESQGSGKFKRSTTRQLFQRKSIDTGYTLETYQTPSRAWKWVTPWMINMRSATDEQGWEYNLWFNKAHWRAFPMRLNWWGWVRRRQWLRLRALVPGQHSKEVELEDDEFVEDEAEGEDGQPADVVVYKSLHDFLAQSNPGMSMIFYLATFPLDREKQAAWTKMVSGADDGDRDKLKKLLKDNGQLSSLARSFIYPASRTDFLKDLEKHGLINEVQCSRCLTPV